MKPKLSLFTLLLSSASLLAEPIADSIFHNGTVITINDAEPLAEAVAVKDGKILAVGGKEEVFKLKGADTRLNDL